MTAPRFPKVDHSAGHYESVYLKACHPAGGQGVWIRYTVHKRPHAEPKGFLWFALFAAGQGVRASKVAVGAPAAAADAYIVLGDARFAPGTVVGRADSPQLDASWALEFDPRVEPLWHLPKPWMYTAPIPKTKALTPYPGTTFTGRLVVAGETIAVEGWPGAVGHNWGSEHAKRAIWLHGTNFSGHESSWLDVVVARIKQGPLITPWIANGVLSLDGRRHRLGGVGRLRRTSIEETPERCRFVLPGHGVRLEGETGSERENFISWIYTQPSGEERQTVNCSIADMELRVWRGEPQPLSLAVSGGAAYELQMDERYDPIPVQPFADG